MISTTRINVSFALACVPPTSSSHRQDFQCTIALTTPKQAGQEVTKSAMPCTPSTYLGRLGDAYLIGRVQVSPTRNEWFAFLSWGPEPTSLHGSARRLTGTQIIDVTNRVAEGRRCPYRDV
jgi:hypothetical protein